MHIFTNKYSQNYVLFYYLLFSTVIDAAFLSEEDFSFNFKNFENRWKWTKFNFI